MKTARAGHACAWCRFKQLSNDQDMNDTLNKPWALVVVGGHTEGNGKLYNFIKLTQSM